MPDDLREQLSAIVLEACIESDLTSLGTSAFSDSYAREILALPTIRRALRALDLIEGDRRDEALHAIREAGVIAGARASLAALAALLDEDAET